MVVLTETCSRKITSFFIPLQPVVTATSLAGFPYEIMLLLILHKKYSNFDDVTFFYRKKTNLNKTLHT